MLTTKEKTRTSKFLSKVLRHAPESVDITLDDNGWTNVSMLIRALGQHGTQLTIANLFDLVLTNDKQRFELSDDNILIRASQGHSVTIDLGLISTEPYDTLYHGTNQTSLDSIHDDKQISKRNRHHVHLSKDKDVANNVGRRHGGKVVVVVIDAAQMHKDGYEFFISKNGVWLTAKVPTKYITDTIY